MSINSTTSASSSTATIPMIGSSTIARFAHLITVKLTTKENYPQWRAQFLPYLGSNNLLGIIDGTIKAPPETITKTIVDGAVQETNLEFLT
jgi:hypothetical protein